MGVVLQQVETQVLYFPDGTYYVDIGPVTMTVRAEVKGNAIIGLESSLTETVNRLLREVSQSLDFLRTRDCHLLSDEVVEKFAVDSLTGKMVSAVRRSGDSRLTPMAAVAGAISEGVLESLKSSKASKIIVNNGGDIAIFLQPQESATLAIVHGRGGQKRTYELTLNGRDRIAGIATSGLGGRSLTLGIADGVTVFGARASIADALATSLANRSFVERPEVERRLAREIDPTSDIADEMVVTAVDSLTAETVNESLAKVRQAAEDACARHLMTGALITIAGVSEYVGRDLGLSLQSA